MYAKIAPLKRLPKSFSVCDYLLPQELEDKIQIGQLVQIPFRKSKIFGLVLSLEENSTYADKVKPIENIINPVPFLRHDEVQLFQDLALVYHDNLGSLMESALPPLQKRKIQTIDLVPFSKNFSKKKPIRFYEYLSEQAHHNILQSTDEHQTLLLVPEIHRIEEIAKMFPNKKVAIWHSELGTKEKFATWLQIRNGEVDIVIGTRSAVFLTFFDLKNIVLVDEEHKDHKQEDGTPRFSAKDIARSKAELCGAQIILTSSHPSSETYYHIYSHEYEMKDTVIESNKTLGVIHVPAKDPPIFIDQKNEILGHKTDYFISSRIQEQITESTGDIFLFLNRRGSATSLYCQSCGYKDSCPQCKNTRVYHETDRMLHCHYCKTREPVPLQCPKCHTPILQFRGYGTEQLEKTLKNIVVDKQIQIIRLDSDVPEKLRAEILQQKGQKIIIGTELSFQYLDWSTIGLLVCINLDSMLSVPEYNGEEKLWHLIQQLQYSRTDESKFYIQTKSPEHPFWKTLGDPDLFYRTDLKKRKQFGYPPYSYLVKYFYGGTTSAEAKQATTEFKEKMAQILTKTGKKATLYDPIELYPHFYRKKYWYGIIALFPPSTWMLEAKEVTPLLNDLWKVDPRPNSILTP